MFLINNWALRQMPLFYIALECTPSHPLLRIYYLDLGFSKPSFSLPKNVFKEHRKTSRRFKIQKNTIRGNGWGGETFESNLVFSGNRFNSAVRKKLQISTS